MALKTYIDSGVLISAVRGGNERWPHGATVSDVALSFLYDPLREYVTSDYVKVEILPRCMFHGNTAEQRFYEDFFRRSSTHVPSSDALLEFAIEEGGKTGIAGMDAIHVAAAVVASAEELITGERPEKLINQAKGLRVISIRPPKPIDNRLMTRIRKALKAKLRHLADRL